MFSCELVNFRAMVVLSKTGPNKASVADFWRMIWEYDIKKIVMLTNLVESGKVPFGRK